MKKHLQIPLGILLLVLLAGLFYFLSQSGERRYSWEESYESEGDQPYDLRLFREIFASFFPERKFYSIDPFAGDSSFLEEQGVNLVYIAGRLSLDSDWATRLEAFAKKGNTVFLSSAREHSLMERICNACGDIPQGRCMERVKADSIELYVTYSGDSALAALDYRAIDRSLSYPWSHFNLHHCHESSITKGGGFSAFGMDCINYLSWEYGEGSILLHSTPLVFTNFHLLREEVLDHVEAVLGLLQDGDVYFVEPSAASAPPPHRPLVSESPLRFILGNEALRLSWYLLLLLCLLYVVDRLRRRERSVPVIAKRDNETLKFLDVMYRLYRKEGKHKDIIAEKYALLLSFLRKRYGITGSPERKTKDDYIRQAAQKLEMDAEELEPFFTEMERARFNSTLSDEEFLATYRKINQFYAKCQ